MRQYELGLEVLRMLLTRSDIPLEQAPAELNRLLVSLQAGSHSRPCSTCGKA